MSRKLTEVHWRDHPRLSHPNARRLPRAFLFLLMVSGLSSMFLAQELPIGSEERSVIETMLDDVKADLKGSYYDPQFHGVDLDVRFKQAKELVKNAKTYNQAIATVAWH